MISALYLGEKEEDKKEKNPYLDPILEEEEEEDENDFGDPAVLSAIHSPQVQWQQEGGCAFVLNFLCSDCCLAQDSLSLK